MNVHGTTMNETKMLEAEMAIRAGKIVWDMNGISGF